MGIRETLNRSPGLTTGAVGGIIVLALIYIGVQLFAGRSPQASFTPPTKAWYTVDDGATYFPDDINRVPPYTHDGKAAVTAHVFTCDGGKNKFVAYLERFTPEGKKRREMVNSRNMGGIPEDVDLIGKEVKLPKTADKWWIRKIEPRAAEVMSPKCKEGNPENLTEVWPE